MMFEPRVGDLMSWVSSMGVSRQVVLQKVTDDGRCFGRSKKYNLLSLVSKNRMNAHIPKEYL